jgi:phospholipase/carboxylesterase
MELGGLDVLVTGGLDGDGGGNGALVVLLHGFGAGGDDLVPLWRVIDVPREVRFAFPAAPIDLGAPYGGGRAWWMIDLEDRLRRQARGEFDVATIPDGLANARGMVLSMLSELTARLSAPSIVLGGFSQGAMLALDVALHSETTLSGLVLMSATYIAAEEWTPRFAARRGLRVLMSHGREDELLPFFLSEQLRDALMENGLRVEWLPFRGGHAIPNEVVDRLGSFVREQSPPA